VDAGIVTLEVSVRFTDRHVRFARERDIATGKAVD
jgi:hypothetical protein